MLLTLKSVQEKHPPDQFFSPHLQSKIRQKEQ